MHGICIVDARPKVYNCKGVKAKDILLPRTDKSIAPVRSFCKKPNIKGIADISNFGINDSLTFQHSSFKDYSISYKDLESVNFNVKLDESLINLNEIVVSANRWEQNKREVPNKINSQEVADTIVSALKMRDKGFIPEVTIWATNPF